MCTKINLSITNHCKLMKYKKEDRTKNSKNVFNNVALFPLHLRDHSIWAESSLFIIVLFNTRLPQQIKIRLPLTPTFYTTLGNSKAKDDLTAIIKNFPFVVFIYLHLNL